MKIKKRVTAAGIVILLLTAIVAGTGIYWKIHAKNVGKNVGSSVGTVVGRFVGSFEGLTVGRADGTEAGKNDGLSAEDTETFVREQMVQTEKLEVLVASAQLKNFHVVGGETDDSVENTGTLAEVEDPQYAALYLVNATVVFAVDLSQAEITTQESDHTLHICLPQPECNVYIDDDVVQEAKYQRSWFTGSAESGFDAYLNTMKQIQIASADTLSNYDQLEESARNAAVNQVSILVSAVSIGDYTPVIEWAE